MLIVYANSIEKKETDQATGEEKTERIPFLKSYTVFNAEQVEGLPAKYYATPAHPPTRFPSSNDWRSPNGFSPPPRAMRRRLSANCRFSSRTFA